MADDSPTPAAPAGSGARTEPITDAEWEKIAYYTSSPCSEPRRLLVRMTDALAEATLAREAAERERDEAYASHSAVAEIAIRGGIKGLRDSNRIATLESALAASTEREAGLRALCAEALEEVYSAFAAAVMLASPPSIVNPAFRAEELWAFAKARNSRDALRARLASLAAPEGGTTDG